MAIFLGRAKFWDFTWSICCCNNDNLAIRAIVEAVNLSEKRSHDGIMHLFLLMIPHGTEPIDFIEKNNARTFQSRFFKKCANIFIRISIELAQHVRTLSSEKSKLRPKLLRSLRKCSGKKSFPQMK